MAELARLDENGIADLSVSTPAMQAVFRREITEREDLARFARSGKTAEGTARSSQRPGGEELLRWAQHYLLLGWLQEERVLDMDRLAARYRNGARKLASHLGADDEEETRYPRGTARRHDRPCPRRSRCTFAFMAVHAGTAFNPVASRGGVLYGG